MKQTLTRQQSKDHNFRIGILNTHPVQYYAPWYKALAERVDLEVFYCHKLTPQEQGRAGFDVSFDWDVPLLEGYSYRFLKNLSKSPNVFTFFGCDTPEIYDIIQQSNFDAFIVHGWYVKSFWQAMKACWQSATPVLVRGDSQLLTPRTWLRRLIKYPFYRSFIPRFDGYLVVGERARQYYLHYGADSQQMFFVPHTVDNDFFSDQVLSMRAHRDQLRSNWNIPLDAVVFVFAGKLIKKKRPEDFIRAIALVSSLELKMYGLVVGDGPLRSGLEEMTRREGLPVSFTGFLNQREISKAYAVSDVLVLPSDGGETWGLVVNEAMASGLPAIVSDRVGCGPDLVYQRKTGAVFPCGNIEKLASLLKYMLQNRDEIEYMGKNASKLIQDYSVHKAVEGTLKAVLSIKR